MWVVALLNQSTGHLPLHYNTWWKYMFGETIWMRYFREIPGRSYAFYLSSVLVNAQISFMSYSIHSSRNILYSYYNKKNTVCDQFISSTYVFHFHFGSQRFFPPFLASPTDFTQMQQMNLQVQIWNIGRVPVYLEYNMQTAQILSLSKGLCKKGSEPEQLINWLSTKHSNRFDYITTAFVLLYTKQLFLLWKIGSAVKSHPILWWLQRVFKNRDGML